MSSRLTSAVRSLSGRSDSQTLDRRTRSTTPSSKQIKDSPSKGVAVFNTRPGTTIEVTVKTKDHIGPPSLMPSSRTNSEKKDPSSKTNWNQILSDQTRTSIKGAMQQQSQSSLKTQSSRPRTRSSSTDDKTIPIKRQQSKYNPRTDKLIDTIPQKLPASSSRKKIHDTGAMNNNYSAITMIDSSEPITVFDKGIQCGGVFDCSSGSLSLFNPVRTLGFLMKELERYVYDEKASKILTEMEQALLRIPTEPGKISPEDLEVISMRNNLEAVTTKLAAKSKQMESMYEVIIKEKEQLKQENREQKYLIDQAVQRENELESFIRRQRIELNKAHCVLKTEQSNRKKIFELEEEIKKMEAREKELKNDLNEQTEAAQQAFFEQQYLKLEKEKITALSNFKDTQLVDHRKSIKNLQNLIHNQLISLSKESSLDGKFDANKSDCSTVIRGGGIASSSHMSPDNSVAPMTFCDGSQLSISNVTIREENNHTVVPIKSIPLKDESVQTLDNMLNESGGEKFKEKTHLEFTSLAGEEISRTTSGFNRNNDDTVYKNLDEVDSHTSKRRTLHSIIIDNNPSSIEVKKTKLKTRKSMNDKKSPKRMDYRNSDDEKKFKSKFNEQKPLDEVKIMFENARMKSHFNVKIPSPPRHYPDPNWTDSSLPTMSITESNIV